MAYAMYHYKGEARREKDAHVRQPKRRSNRRSLGLKPKGKKQK